MAYRNVASEIKYWVVCKITEEKVIAKERTATHDSTRIIEGSLEHVRHMIRNMNFYNFVQFKPNPEKIVELWY